MSFTNTKSWKNLKSPVALAISLGLVANMAQAADGIKAAYVETVIPSKAVSYRTDLHVNQTLGVGPGTGVFGVSSITITNLLDSQAEVLIFSATTNAPGNCGKPGAQYSFGADGPNTLMIVQPNSTLHFTYPSPLVFDSISGSTCVGINYPAQGGGANNFYSLSVSINGFVN